MKNYLVLNYIYIIYIIFNINILLKITYIIFIYIIDVSSETTICLLNKADIISVQFGRHG